ncbi:MAG: hypothetical protein J6A07_05560 [Firmicutes bacterium]|nr:hypothetical protein [Bacillota bacterium]
MCAFFLDGDLYDKLKPLIEALLNTDTSEDSLIRIGYFLFYIAIPILACVISDISFGKWRLDTLLGGLAKPLAKPKKIISNKGQSVFENDKPHYYTVDYCHWFIQNNTNAIVQWMKMFTPDFRSRNFIIFAKDVFAHFTKVRDAEKMGGRVSFDVRATYLPDEIKEYGNCYLHNYILTNGYENLKVYISIPDENAFEVDVMQSFFLTFSKKNPLVGVIDGQFLNIECPNCGGSIDMKADSRNICPYCGGTVTFAESDWILTGIELIKSDTLICNNAVIKSY